MKKIVNVILVLTVCFSMCACGFSVSTETSSTGQLTTSINNNKVKLNHSEYEFPEGYSFKDGKIKSPVGMSYVQIYNREDEVVGVCADGYYTETISKDTMKDAVNTVYKAAHNVDSSLQLTDDLFVEGKNLILLTISLDDGSAIFIGKLGTPDFAYITQSKSDKDNIMQDYLEQVVLQLGNQEDYEILFSEDK
ncbi:hypothetical protein SAMN04487830_12226 [Pseudobutyrivibrio sp. OR37]|nr:hypothetical protein SAMN04487830_12226 [Pseudobutyrivibrio sp. OR37]